MTTYSNTVCPHTAEEPCSKFDMTLLSGTGSECTPLPKNQFEVCSNTLSYVIQNILCSGKPEASQPQF